MANRDFFRRPGLADEVAAPERLAADRRRAWEMTGFTPDVPEWTLTRTGILQELGLGFMLVPLSTIAFATLPGHLRTQGTALYSLIATSARASASRW